MKNKIGLNIWVVVWILCMIILFLPSQNTPIATENNIPNPTNVETLEVHYIDVGQGDCTLLSCGGQTMLIDCGDSSHGIAIQSYLYEQDIEYIDYLVLTHPDADHIGGAPVIITKFDIGQIYMSDYEKDNMIYEKLLDSMEYRYYSWATPTVGDTILLGSTKLTFIGPVTEYDSPNDSSLCLIAQNGETSFLFSGDAEDRAEMDMLLSGADVNVDVYKVAHHGSSSSSSTAFLSAMHPKYAVISCGKDNDYGHPHRSVIDSLESMGISIFRTDKQGSIIATSDGEKILWNINSYSEKSMNNQHIRGLWILDDLREFFEFEYLKAIFK